MASFKKAIVFIQFAGIFLFSISCNSQKKEKFENTERYDLATPKVLELPQELDEISGIAYYPKDTSVFAIIDEDGILYKISLRNVNSIQQWKFDKKRDFEDLVLLDSVFYVLVSNGDIESIRFEGKKIITNKSNFSGESKKVNEFESLYYNNDSSRLIMICKSCEDDPKKSISTFSYDVNDSSMSYSPFKTFDMTQLESKYNIDKHLKASSAAINPVNGDLYVISSILKLLVITSPDGVFKISYKLDPSIYKQPEGIAFTPDGDMIISNESAGEGFANLLLFKNKMKGR